VCESHAKQLGRSREHCPDVRLITDQSDDRHNTIKDEEPTQTPQVAVIKPKRPVPPESARSLPEPKVARAKADPSVRTPVRDLTYGNSAKAMVDEVIWNMAPGDFDVYKMALRQGRSAKEAAQAAGGQLAVIHQKISEYSLKLEAVLSESKATINIGEAIDKPLERAVLEIINKDAMSDTEKDAAIQQLGALQEWVKEGLQGDITPLQAHRILLPIGDRLNWGGTSGVSEEFKPVYRELFGGLKTAIHTTVPEAQNLHDRLTNLYAAKSELQVC
jgi:hypothetical protein